MFRSVEYLSARAADALNRKTGGPLVGVTVATWLLVSQRGGSTSKGLHRPPVPALYLRRWSRRPFSIFILYTCTSFVSTRRHHISIFFEVKIHLNLESAEWRLPPNEIQVEMNEKKNEINCADELTGAEYSNETSFHAPRSVLIDVHLWLIERHTNDEIISARFGRCHGDRVAFFGGEKWQLTWHKIGTIFFFREEENRKRTRLTRQCETTGSWKLSSLCCAL